MPEQKVVAQYMTESPHCIGVDQTLELATDRMHRFGVRHLPVLDGGQLVGVLSERDISLAGAVAPHDLSRIRVEEVMTGVPYCTVPEAPLQEAVRHMHSRKLGSCVVMTEGKVVGVLTTTDALRLLLELLDQEQAA